MGGASRRRVRACHAGTAGGGIYAHCVRACWANGTALVVSHDRYFISQVANKIVEIRDGEFRVYLGDYHYYLDKKAEEKEQAELAAAEAEKAAKKAAKAAKAGAKQK